MIKITCSCGQALKVKSEYAGKRVKCPGCQSALTIPQPTETAGASEGRTPLKKTARPAAKKKKRRAAPPPPIDDSVEEIEDVDYGDDFDDSQEDGFDDYEADDFGEQEYQAAPPTRKKKKSTKKKSSQGKKASSGSQSDIPPKVMYSLFALAGTVCAVVMFFIVRSIMSTAAAESDSQALPETFAVYKHEQVSLSSDYPDAKGWTKDSGGGTGGVPPWIRYKNEKQDVTINIRGSASGTAVMDISTAGGGFGDLQDQLPDELHPAAAVHQYQHDKISADYNSYEETEPQKVETRFGEGRISDFTGSSVLSTDDGIRATLLANQYQYNVICKLPKKRLEEYRPILMRIIKSIGR